MAATKSHPSPIAPAPEPPVARRPSVHSSNSCSSGSSYSGSSEGSGSSTSGPSKVQQLVPRVAKLVATMAITDPEVLRTAPAHKAFEHCAEAFRPGERQLFQKSRRSEEITRFWSHSWHGNSVAKVLTLMVFYNGLASVLLGTLVAFLMMCLFSLGLLPGFQRVAGLPDRFFSTWSLASGIVTSVAVFIFWKPQEDIFFDRLCISEEDPRLKNQAIFSLAGMLRKSRQMMVLWDPSWSDRLWCLFELSAFLKCRKAEGQQQGLIIRPTFVGPCSVITYATVCFAMLPLTTLPMSAEDEWMILLPVGGLMLFGALVGFLAMMVFRAYFYSVKILEEKLKKVSFDQVRSSCCDAEHVTPSGQEMLCDRLVVTQCVATWFGSTEAFEASIRSDVAEVVVEELRHDVFTGSWVLQVLSPALWAFMDLVATNLRVGHWDSAAEMLVVGLAVWLFYGPMFSDFMIFLTRRYCGWAPAWRWLPRTWADRLLKLLLFFALGMAVVCLASTYILTRFLLPAWDMTWLRTAVFAAVVVILFSLAVALKRFIHGSRRPRLAQPAMHPAGHTTMGEAMDTLETRTAIISL